MRDKIGGSAGVEKRRRVVKTASNSGDLDGVTDYDHNSNQIIETRDGSGNLETQVYPKMDKKGDCPPFFPFSPKLSDLLKLLALGSARRPS
ncbi:MAG: hypothetical protein R3E58_11315 [Phycisphaerae bacterium]